VLPILTELLKDDNAEVRLNVTANLIKLADIVSVDLLSPSFLTILQNMTKDAQWRVRMGVIELVGDLSLKFGREIYMKSLEGIFMNYLTNPAASVREMGVSKVQSMAVLFKSDWVVTSFVPKIVETYGVEKQGFNYRMSCLMSLSAVVPVMQKDQITEKVVPTLVTACSDKIPNVQFCCAKIIKQHKSLIDASVFTQ
jgi:serine/threonine-protein phosphatase 2A regulatory subunit A